MARIIFDLDGTLVDSLASLASAGRQLTGELGRPAVDDATYRGFVGHGIGHQVRCLLDSTGGADDALFDRALARFHDIYGADPASGVNAYPGARAALDALSAGGHRCGICTQKPEAPSRAILAATGLADRIEGGAFGDSLPVLKPDPEMLYFAARSMGGGAPVIFVGDSHVDAQTAQAAGVPFILHRAGFHDSGAPPDADAGFDRFADLPDLVAQLCKSPEVAGAP
ncbi:HAD-IA family hydrolase [Oceanomicrobium pacificus]|uniref:phosphoglycolate phosphatase n=1 Tax=Oceanomicrobium pacificus TaxID=2692916 RepID=A0A6B0TLU3_9RHOB|nr:HAD-IA family hydrolase [Oceanomicrobium pacificus]MXU65520.1 HAD-IA family hydrolase [Oceanomicrobium pacificus]